MPIINHASAPVAEPRPGMRSRAIVNKEAGSVSLTVSEITMAPGAIIPLHIHPTHEESIVIVEGTVEVVLGDQTLTLGAGNTILAPSGVKHGLTNRSSQPVRALAIFPTTAPQRTFL